MPQHLLDQREQVRQRTLACPMSPEEARAVEAAYRDYLANDEEEATYRAALVAMAVEPEPPIGVGRHRLQDREGGHAGVSHAAQRPEGDCVHIRSTRMRRRGGGGRVCERVQSP